MTKSERAKLIEERHRQMSAFDYEYSNKELLTVCGVDEAGRGPLFGSVYSACALIKPGPELIEVYDSKSLSEKRRSFLYEKILENALAYGVASSDAAYIDKFGINEAIKTAMYKAVQEADNMLKDKKIDFILVDHISFDLDAYAHIKIKKGDQKSFQIAAASIIAKVARDNEIMKKAEIYPEYKLGSNKGYGTREHIEAIKKHGASPEHRLSFLKGIL